MRIIGGTSAGATLKVPKGLEVRPTPDKVRLAIFNSLAGFAEEARVLEVFAGTGALGLECLSRGAASATFVELSARHARVLQVNAKSIGIPPGQTRFIIRDAFIALAQLRGNGAKFDLVMADPPYGEKNVNRRSESFAQRMLDDENLPALLEPSGLFVLGHTKRDTLEIPGPWVLKKTLKHGDTLIEILHMAKG
ncbi:MAG: 16S rRNA (guanine(966)-N(2))-methyltransferase RsmD [Verrucomicrobiota bacterium]|nr:16S rRNA (guanine(966)-N(2))-methyltransferase RsmD [Verrucomicrobiota bacterium]